MFVKQHVPADTNAKKSQPFLSVKLLKTRDKNLNFSLVQADVPRVSDRQVVQID